MNSKKLIIAFLFVDFVALNLWAFASTGLSALIDLVTHPTPWLAVLMADLVIALGMVATWMVNDAKRLGKNAWPYVVVTACLGSVGTLGYLLRREE